MDRLGITKEEMMRPLKNVIVRNAIPALIDFERARKTEKPHNVTQFCQFLLNWRDVLRKKGIKIDKRSLIERARAYKQAPNNKTFNEIIKVLYG
jgi:predicted Ser/Thr protein kinase